MKWRRSYPDPAADRPDDWSLHDDHGRSLARIYVYRHGPSAGKWFWAWQGYPAASGVADDGAAAKAECERRAWEAQSDG